MLLAAVAACARVCVLPELAIAVLHRIKSRQNCPAVSTDYIHNMHASVLMYNLNVTRRRAHLQGFFKSFFCE